MTITMYHLIQSKYMCDICQTSRNKTLKLPTQSFCYVCLHSCLGIVHGQNQPTIATRERFIKTGIFILNQKIFLFFTHIIRFLKPLRGGNCYNKRGKYYHKGNNYYQRRGNY